MRSLKLHPLAQTPLRKQKLKKISKILTSFRPPDMFQHTDDLKRAFVFGKNQFIGALTPNNIDSAVFTKSVVKQFDFQYLILGNFNNYHLSILDQTKPDLLINPSDLFCKNQLSNYMSNVESKQNHQGIYNFNDKIYYEIDQRYRQIWTNDYMTAGLFSLDNQDMKTLFGLPSSIITLEDIMLKFQLGQLEQMYFQVINQVKTNYKDQLSYSPRMIDLIITDVAAEKFKNHLHSKSILYMAAIFRSCAKIGKSNLLLCNRHFVNQVRHFIQKSSVNAELIYRGYFDNPNHQDYELYKRRIKQQSRVQVFKKFYLASKLVDNSALKSMENGYNILRDSIFHKKIPRLSVSSQVNEIYKQCQNYDRAYWDIQTQFIANNLINSDCLLPKRITLTQQLKQIQDRQLDFPIQYQANSIKQDIIQQSQMERIQSIMEDYLKSQHRLRDAELLQQYKNKEYSKQNITMYTKLIGQLKIKTNSRLKLPLHHFKHFSGYYKQVMKDLILESQYGIKKIQEPQKVLNIQVRDNLTAKQLLQIVKKGEDALEDRKFEVLDAKTVIKKWEADSEEQTIHR